MNILAKESTVLHLLGIHRQEIIFLCNIAFIKNMIGIYALN